MTGIAPKAHCLDCGYAFDAASAVGGTGPRTPEPDDVSVCIQCGAIALYRATAFGLVLGRPTVEELADIHAQLGDTLSKVQTGIERVHGR